MYKLSPHGEKAKAFCYFTKSHADVGINYTLIALVMDFYCGSCIGLDTSKKVFFSTIILPGAIDLKFGDFALARRKERGKRYWSVNRPMLAFD